MALTRDVESRSVVKCCVGLGKTPAETTILTQTSGTLQPCGNTFLYKWHERFRNGRKLIENNTDLAFMDLRVFPEVKTHLRGESFEKGQRAVQRILSSTWCEDNYTK